ncbi:hypothetical protein Acr_00g0025590 [Actinidia rufa]|uniref:Uncharacterized protein n=1 Tax=Actinidia rufa TaxID=165716 RepID=A0A7J0DDE3_9ERIC|nr:hypothetical protein Acr_00g0025590 [Actinidia rufa]
MLSLRRQPRPCQLAISPSSKSFSVQIRLLEVDEAITSTHPGGMAFYEATFQAKEYPTRGYPSNVKGWKKKFFFISGENLEFSPGISRDAGGPSDRGAKPRWDLGLTNGGDFFTIKEVLDTKSFLRSFRLAFKLMASSGRDSAEDIQVGDAVPVTGDEGESHYFRDNPRRGDNSRDDSVEYLEIIWKRHRRVLSRLLDRILLTLLGAKIQPSFLSWEPSSSSLSSSFSRRPS